MKKPNIIILEGPDGSGKTMLGHALARHYDAAYLHTPAPVEGIQQLAYDMRIAEQAIFMKIELKHTVILDRSWPSEVCYGSILRSTWCDPKPIEQKLYNAKAIYVFCQGTQNTYNNYLASHKDEVMSLMVYLQLSAAYLGLSVGLKQSCNRVIDYNINFSPSAMSMIEHIDALTA